MDKKRRKIVRVGSGKRNTVAASTTSGGQYLALTVLTGIFVGAMVFAYTKDTPPSLNHSQDQFRANLAAGEETKAKIVQVESNRVLPPKSENSRSVDLEQPSVPFEKCGEERVNCVVDGDTFWLNGTKIRIADMDAPEISKPMCAEEYALGMRATDRLITLLNLGQFQLQQYGDQTTDKYGRTLAVVVRDGNSLGVQLVSEGLAHPWTGQRKPWC
jgi:micrococcal nuclease